MSQSVVFVTPLGCRYNVMGGGGVQPRYGPVLLATILKKAGFDVRVIQENWLERPIRPQDIDADWLALSLYTSAAPNGYKICEMYRTIRPNGRIVAGGVHPTFCPDDVLPHVDYVVKGEGENIIVDLLKYGSNEKVIEGTPVADLDSLPIPDFSLLQGSNLYLRDYPIVTSRGCLYKCEYCPAWRLFGSSYRAMSPERVVEEMKAAPPYVKIKINDDNFALDYKRCEQILDRLAAIGFSTPWFCVMNAARARDSHFVKKMKAAGCHTVGIGIESLNDKAQKAGHTVGMAYEAVRNLLKHGIHADTYFMIGLDSDELEELPEIVNFCQREQVSTYLLMILTPYPGTLLAERLEREGRIFERNWEYYDSMHIVFHPMNMSARDLQLEHTKLHKKLAGPASRLGDWLVCIADIIRNPQDARRIQYFARSRIQWKRNIYRIIRQWERESRGYVENLPDKCLFDKSRQGEAAQDQKE